MIRSLLILSLAITFVSGIGKSAFAQSVRLRSQIAPNCDTGPRDATLKFTDIYADGNIAVQGSYNCRGAFIYDVSNPDAPRLASVYDPGNQQYLEAIVIGTRAYFGSGNGGGVHIVDLSDPSRPVFLGIVDSTHGNGHDAIHEMVVFRQDGIDYLIENFNGFSNKFIKVINVSDPTAPVFVRDIDPQEINWVHAMHIRGNRMYTSGWGNSGTRGKTEIYDISNLATQTPQPLGFIEDAGGVTAGNQMHSSWTSEDGRYLYSAREVTNSNGPTPGDVRIYDVSDPAEPFLINRISMSDLRLNAITPHNPVVMGDKLYVSWYQAGLQVFDLSQPNVPVRLGQYDTFEAAFAPDELQGELSDEPFDMVCGGTSLQNALPTSYDGAWAVFPFLGEDRVLIGDFVRGLLIVDVTSAKLPPKNIISDFDGDRKTDFSVFTPSTGTWTVANSSNGSISSEQWGITGDVIVPGDYDGDGKSDQAIWRPSTGVWWFIYSSNGLRPAVKFGSNGDIPVPADYDADGKTDIAVWRPSDGVWYIFQSTVGIRYIQWGSTGDKVLSGDYEGDGKSDIAVWRPSTGVWYILQSSSSLPLFYAFGSVGDKPLFGDFDGDRKADPAVFRPSTGLWYILNSANGAFSGFQFGLSDDLPIPADHDGDGKSDASVFRPSTRTWYHINSSNGNTIIREFGLSDDEPSPSSVQPD
ncbi:MAG: FG-GAP-like repeat-containing protein [Pyrinomonadaceae bacterium]